MNVDKKVCVITGAAKGLGKGIAEKFSAEGNIVIIADILGENAKKLAEEFIRAGGIAVAYQIDLTKVKEIDEMFSEIVKTYNRIDVLVNNAGITVRKLFTDITEEDYDQIMNVNLKSYYFCCRAAAKQMKTQENGGAIVCISSSNSIKFTTKRTPYCISKAAVNGLVSALANELGRDKIRVNGIAPGYVITDMVKEGIAQGIIDVEKIMSVIPMKRFMKIEEIANAVYFLASDEASGISGQTLFVDGGWNSNGLPED